jgi:hypothetical protein
MSLPWHHQYRLTSTRFDNASELPPLSTVTKTSGGPLEPLHNIQIQHLNYPSQCICVTYLFIDIIQH